MNILATLSTFVLIFVYSTVMWLLRLNFKKRFVVSFFDTIGAPLGLIASIIAVTGCLINNISILVVGYSISFVAFAFLLVSNLVSFRDENYFNSKIATSITRIIGISFAALGIILTIILGQFL
jgi:hypothetical protein